MGWIGLIPLESILQVVGAYIGYSVARIAHRGYITTHSPTLLRLTLAFTFLSVGFVISSISGLVGIIPHIVPLAGILITIAAALEMVGYFFLAFSHIVDVRMMYRVGLPSITMPVIVVTAAIKSLSLYFLFYTIAETIISYRMVKKRITLIIAIGLALIACGELIRWISLLYPELTIVLLISILMKVGGLSTFYTPVVKFSLKKGGGL
ncbi:MAG: hypothetical protein RMJ31_00070 [Nitrososphaerota archaeon]|nr:hypothetical protein [Nitrososphaerales archaeon]MDW8044160.1 hypothetical protein [Nitrososphaerota archaeon]